MIRTSVTVFQSSTKPEHHKLRFSGWTFRGDYTENGHATLSAEELVKLLRTRPKAWQEFRDLVVDEWTKDLEAAARKAAQKVAS